MLHKLFNENALRIVSNIFCPFILMLTLGCFPPQTVDPIEPTLESIQTYVFDQYCLDCHGATDPIHGADYSAGHSLDNLVYKQSFMEPDFNLIEPGDPDNSLLVKKLEGSAKTASMPWLGAVIPQYKVAAIRQWVAEMQPTPQPTLRYIQKNIFDESCANSGCHASTSPAAGLDLSEGNSVNSLLGVSSSLELLNLIEPGQPDNSYLIHKLEGTHQVGLSMPAEQAALSSVKIAAVRGWIETLTGPQPNLSWIQENIFDVSCAYSGCHDSATHAQGLDLTVGNALANTMSVNSVLEPAFKLLVPGDPDNSYIIKKLEGTHSVGISMPWLAPALSAEKINTVRGWIAGINAHCNDNTGSEVNWSATNSDCTNLASYNLFTNPANPLGATNSGGVPYDLTSPLFTDYALKHRQIFIPDGQQIQYNGGDFVFPEGTIIAKTFYYLDDETNPQVTNILETRLMINRGKAGWSFLPYIWNNGVATLSLKGAQMPVAWINANGDPRATDYKVPSAGACTDCHHPLDTPLGPRVAHINDDYDYGAGVIENQISHWVNAGILSGAPANPAATAPRHPVWNDPADGTLEERALAYLDSNCVHCHNNQLGKAAGTSLWLMAEQLVGYNTGICKPQLEVGASNGGYTYDIVPGDAAQSILTYRMDSIEPSIMMAELGRTMVHTEGVQLIADWINSLGGGCP